MAGFGTDIANLAMVHLGQRRISDIEDTGDTNAVLAKQFLAASVATVSRGHPWNDLYRRDRIGADATAPAFGWAYRYTLPVGCVRVLRVNQDKHAIWKKEGPRSIVTDIAAPLDVEWLADGSDLGVIQDPLLKQAIGLHLAWTICLPVTQDGRLKSALKEDWDGARREARTIDAFEGAMADEEEEGVYILAHRGG